jgi:phosphate transport system permease protein
MNVRASTSLWHAKVDQRQVGEPAVWLTAMGLAVCLAMVAGLLLLIAWHGLAVFWPKQIVQLEVEQNGQRTTMGGTIVEERFKEAANGEKVPETLLYVGKKEASGQAFRYIDTKTIRSKTIPAEVMLIERISDGNQIAIPIAIEIKGMEPVLRSDPEFTAKLDALIEESKQRWKTILRIEKGSIGDNANEIVRQQRLQRASPGNTDTAGELATLQKQYEELDRQAKELRARQQDNALKVTLLSGEERTISLSAIVDYTYPNQLGFFQKVGRFALGLWRLVSDNPREVNTEGGIFPAIFGTFLMTILMSVLVVPFGVLAAIYLREYAKQGPFVRAVRIAVNNLAGVPSIVFGVFGLGFFVYLVGGNIDAWLFSERWPEPTFGTGGILWASLTLALMTVPVVIVATEESIAAVPRGAREGSLACGASKWQTIQRVVLPASIPGILTGMILAMARGAGEVAPLMLVGVVKLAPVPIDAQFPFVHFDQKFMHLGFYIFDLGFQSQDSQAARPMVYATTMVLILLVLVLNLGAIMVRERLRRRLATAAF